MGLQIQIQVLNANTGGEIDAAFATIGRERPDLSIGIRSGPRIGIQKGPPLLTF
jgi:hypothetical protein